MPSLCRRTLIAFALLLAACAPTSPPVIPTAAVLPSPVITPVPTAIPPTWTPDRPSPTPVPPTVVQTRVTDTPAPTLTATPPGIVFESITAALPEVLVSLHRDCLPAAVEIQAIIRSVAPLEQVALSWAYEGRIFRPGARMEQTARADWIAALGPFDQAGTVLYFVTARDANGVQAMSEQASIRVMPCTAPEPLGTAYDGPLPLTPTPPYGAALSIHAHDQQIGAFTGEPLAITLTWDGGFEPILLEVFPPERGTLQGGGPARVYTSPPDYVGPDRFTFRLTDANGQASTGTVYIQVSAPQ